MRVKVIPEDFRVEEQIRLQLASQGAYTLYRVHKQDVTTLEVEVRMAQALGRRRAALQFPALKDRRAVAIQYVAVRGGGPARIEGTGFVAERVGRVAGRLEPGDLLGNRFTVTVRDLAPARAESLPGRLETLAEDGLPNYFDRQRFGSQTAAGDWPGRRILRRDAEGALHAHLAEPLVGDPPAVRAFKQVAAERWGDWNAVFEAAPRPSNYRSLLTYLRDHPDDYRRALDLVTPRVLRLYLDAYQSLLWNRSVARYLTRLLGSPQTTVQIAGELLPLFAGLAGRTPAQAAVPLLHHRAALHDPLLAAVVDEVLAEEGLTLNDLKPRILRNAYLPRGGRPLLLQPADASAALPEPDDLFAGRQKLTLAFTLPPGAYATLVLRAL